MDYRPTLVQLLHDTPDSVDWLRARMFMPEQHESIAAPTTQGTPASRVGSMDGGISVKARSRHVKPKPPFNVTYMDAADREVAVLGRWMDCQALTIAYPVYRVNGVVSGLLGGDTRVVRYMADKLSAWLTCMDRDSVTALDNELWAVRSQHYANWPQLAGFLSPLPAGETPPAEEPGLF